MKRNDSKLTNITFLIIISVTLYLAIDCGIGYSSEDCKSQGERGFYSYSMMDVSRFMEAMGYEELAGFNWYDVTRNSDGSALRIGVQKKRKLIIAKCNGEIEEINTPGELILVDNNNQVIGWYDRPRDKTHFKDNILVRGPFWQFGNIDPGTRFFTETKTVLRGFDIYEISFPLKHLGSVDEDGRIVQALYAKEDLIYVFTEDFSFRCRYNQDCPIILYVFQDKKYKLEGIDKITINKISSIFPTGFHVVDMAPWSNEVVFIEHYDWPNQSKYHQYNLETKDMKKIGNAEALGFYLQCDILQKIMEEKK